MDSPQYCDRCRSTTERTHFQPYNVMPWAKPHDDPDIYSTLVSRNAAVLQSELVSVMLASIVFLSPLCTISQLPTVVSSSYGRTVAATGIIWDMTGCISALMLWVRVRTLKQRNQRLADSFVASISPRPYWTIVTSPYSLICSASVSLVVILLGCIWSVHPDISPHPSISPRSPTELVILSFVVFSAVAHLALVVRRIIQSGRTSDTAGQTEDACCPRVTLGEPQPSNGDDYVADVKP
jgi:hypothetical protein